MTHFNSLHAGIAGCLVCLRVGGDVMGVCVCLGVVWWWGLGCCAGAVEMDRELEEMGRDVLGRGEWVRQV